MKTWKSVAIIEAIVILFLIIYLFKDSLFTSAESNLKTEYEINKDKTVLEMTKEEWIARNKYLSIKAEKENGLIDTISYENALSIAKMDKMRNDPFGLCSELKLIEAYHQMMVFNMPYDKYDKGKIVIQRNDNGWKTFYIFEVHFNFELNKYEMSVVKSDFMG